MKLFILVYNLDVMANCCNFTFAEMYALFGVNSFFTQNHVGVRCVTFIMPQYDGRSWPLQ